MNRPSEQRRIAVILVLGLVGWCCCTHGQPKISGAERIRITEAAPEQVSLRAGDTLRVTCKASGENVAVGSFMFRSQVPVSGSMLPGLTRRSDGYVHLHDPNFINDAHNMCIMDNGALDQDPEAGALLLEIPTADWPAGTYPFHIVAHVRPAGGPYIGDSRPVVVTIEGAATGTVNEIPPVAPPAQTLILNVDFNCRRDNEAGLAAFIRGCAKRGVGRLNVRALMMGYTEHPSKVRMSWGEAAPEFVDRDFDLFRLAVKYCREVEIECYVFYDLFDTRNDRFAAEHPEFRLITRDGKSTCIGALCYAFPEVRAYFDRYIDELLAYGVDGFMFCTKSRHGMPLTAKYGFNEPIALEHKRRFGVDPRTDEYDRDAWLDLQGEYVVSWVKSATERIHRHGGRTAIALPAKKRNHYANLDWRQVVHERAVDELHTSCWRSEEMHLLGVDGLERLREYTDICHEHGVKYSPYLFADMSFRGTYRQLGLVAAQQQAANWVRHVRMAPVDGVMFHDMEIFTTILHDFVNMELIEAAGSAMRAAPRCLSGWEALETADRRKDGEVLYNAGLRSDAANGIACWNVTRRRAESLRRHEDGWVLDSASITRLESAPTALPRNGKDRDTPFCLTLAVRPGPDGEPASLRVVVRRSLGPKVDYELGRHLLHRDQIPVDVMLDQTVTVDATTSDEVVLPFAGGKAQGELDGATAWVTLEPVTGVSVLRSVSLKPVP